MKNKLLALKLQQDTMSDVTDLLKALINGTTEETTRATTAYCQHLQEIVDLVDQPCGKSNCGYFSCKEEMCDRMEMESREVSNDQ